VTLGFEGAAQEARGTLILAFSENNERYEQILAQGNARSR
jgi:hypothetical protein